MTPRPIAIAFILALVVCASSATRGAAAAPSAAYASSPAGVLDRLSAAYEHVSPDELGALLSADYEFHPGDVAAKYATGFDRTFEITSLRGMRDGVKHEGDAPMPAIERVHVIADGVTLAPDPEHLDSTDCYRAIVCRRFGMKLWRVGGKTTTVPAELHVLHVVRGDVARLVDGQSAEPTHWYLRRWLQNVDDATAALAAASGNCEDDPVANAANPMSRDAPDVPRALMVHTLGNPTCPAMAIQCDLPGHEPARVDVFDVSGRLVNHREVAVSTPGTMRIEAGAGTSVAPGVYWVRLSQATRHPSTRMVVVAR
jgi:hypothetical protein